MRRNHDRRVQGPRWVWLSSAAAVCLIAAAATQAAAQPAAATIAGDWEITRRPQFGSPQYDTVRFDVNADRVTGMAGGIKIEGTFRNGVIDATLQRGSDPPIGKLTGALKGGALSGEGNLGENTFTWSARRAADPPRGGPKTHVFAPTQFHNFFTSTIAPVLHVFPGDTVETRSVDAGGTDENGKRRAAGGNPLTGPFFVEGAFPGDTLVVKLNRVRLNRDSAISSGQIVASAVTPGYHRNAKFDDNFSSDWTLDREAGLARLTKPTARLKDYTVPLKPMLGCIGVAPPETASYRSGWLGAWGGNMDYNELREGATLYLPVFHPGALLFLGDGHAVEGDGELTGNALETSMEFSFTVDVIKKKSVPQPRAENAQYRMASGIANSLTDALQQATTNLARWLADDYKLEANEVAVVLGTAIRYDIAEVVDPMIHVVAKIDKKVLEPIPR